jgi:hypothetical protein
VPVAYGGSLYSLREHINTLHDELRALDQSSTSPVETKTASSG